jgi:hypothetical protein
MSDNVQASVLLAGICMLLFLFTGYFYSAPPLRTKAKPFLD